MLGPDRGETPMVVELGRARRIKPLAESAFPVGILIDVSLVRDEPAD
jgi:hypothetical protein